MRKPKIVFDFLRNSDPKLEIQSNAILACMTGNPHFENPVPTLEELNTVMQQYSVSLAAAQHRDRIHVQQKDKDRAKLEMELKRLSNYVMLVGGEDRAILASSGLTVSAETSIKTRMGEVQNFEVTVGKASGEATMSVKGMKEAVFYLHYWALDAENPVWMHKGSKYPSFTVEGLLPMSTYLFQIKAQGVDDEISPSVIIKKGVL